SGVVQVVETALTESEKSELLVAAEAVRTKQADVQSL
ncbi:MAG: malate dehydrogenase, partial [Candidatus Nanopelagicales bacterium]